MTKKRKQIELLESTGKMCDAIKVRNTSTEAELKEIGETKPTPPPHIAKAFDFELIKVEMFTMDGDDDMGLKTMKRTFKAIKKGGNHSPLNHEPKSNMKQN